MVEYLEIGKYIIAYENHVEGRKTPIYELCNSKNELIKLGEIKWNSSWRKYCFYPIDETVFDSKCLMDITSFMNVLNRND